MSTLYASLHPSAVLRNRSWDPIVRWDWKKLGKGLKGEWPLPLPAPIVASEATMGAVMEWLEGAQDADYLALDTEHSHEALYVMGLGYEVLGEPTGLLIPLAWDPPLAPTTRADLVGLVWDLLGKVPTVFHHAATDLAVLTRELGIFRGDLARVDCTLTAHTLLWPTFPHDLRFLGSIYSGYQPVFGGTKLDKNWGDIVMTLESWTALRGELMSRPEVSKDYERRMGR